ncbi:hypothetical protein AHAS_Ahas19G0232600 [Arachis hypogaea]
MAVMVWCVLEARELYLPRHIRRSMGRAHFVGNLAFPCLITQLATEAGDLRMATNERPTVAGHKKIIPHSDWPGLELVLGRRARQQPTSFIEAGPSALAPSAAAPSEAAPPAFLQPLYRLIHRLSDDIARLEGRSKHRYEHLRGMILSGGVDIRPEPDTPPENYREEAQHDELEEVRDGGGDGSDDSFYSA